MPAMGAADQLVLLIQIVGAPNSHPRRHLWPRVLLVTLGRVPTTQGGWVKSVMRAGVRAAGATSRCGRRGAVLVLLPLSLAACTSRGASAHRDPLSVVTAAARRMLTMSGFRYGLTAGSGETVSHGQGEIDLAGHRERLVLNVPTRNTTNGVAT